MHTEENFDLWNKQKQKIHNRTQSNYFVNPGEIRYAYIGLNIGREVCGKGNRFTRPVLVIKQLGSLFLIVPMTTKGKDSHNFYYRLEDSYFGFASFLQLTQIKVMDKKRFTKHIISLSVGDFFDLKEKLREYYL